MTAWTTRTAAIRAPAQTRCACCAHACVFPDALGPSALLDGAGPQAGAWPAHCRARALVGRTTRLAHAPPAPVRGLPPRRAPRAPSRRSLPPSPVGTTGAGRNGACAVCALRRTPPPRCCGTGAGAAARRRSQLTRRGTALRRTPLAARAGRRRRSLRWLCRAGCRLHSSRRQHSRCRRLTRLPQTLLRRRAHPLQPPWQPLQPRVTRCAARRTAQPAWRPQSAR
jgi:hypothetical protein